METNFWYVDLLKHHLHIPTYYYFKQVSNLGEWVAKKGAKSESEQVSAPKNLKNDQLFYKKRLLRYKFPKISALIPSPNTDLDQNIQGPDQSSFFKKKYRKVIILVLHRILMI